MSTTPFVSVIIPTFNRAAIIAKAIESVLDQRYQPLEIIVVDDGSSDDTEAVVKRLDPSICYIWQDNRGPSSARNHGARISRGEILMFLDSDDVWLPGKVKHQVNLFNAAGPEVACCVGNAVLHAANGRTYFSFDVSLLRPNLTDGLWTNPAEVFSTRFLFFNQIAAVRREAFIACGGFDESMRALEDWDFALRLCLCSPCAAWAFTSEVLTSYYYNTEGSLVDIATKDLAALKECALNFQTRVLTLARAKPGVPSAVEHRLRRKLANTRRELRSLRLAASQNAVLALIGRCLIKLDNIRNSANKRFFYPAMEVKPLNLAAPAPHLHAEQTTEQRSH